MANVPAPVVLPLPPSPPISPLQEPARTLQSAGMAKREHKRSLSGHNFEKHEDERRSPTFESVEDFVRNQGGSKVIKRVLIANNGIAVSRETKEGERKKVCVAWVIGHSPTLPSSLSNLHRPSSASGPSDAGRMTRSAMTEPSSLS